MGTRRRRGWRWLLAGCAAAAVAAWVASALTGFTLLVVLQEEPPSARPAGDVPLGTRVALLQGLNLDEGDWTAYIVLEPEDYEELRHVLPRNVWRLEDREQLKTIQRDLTARFTGSDMATVRSRLLLLRDGDVRFCAGVVLDGWSLDGLQTHSWGWVEPPAEVAHDFVRRFEPVSWPFLLL